MKYTFQKLPLFLSVVFLVFSCAVCALLYIKTQSNITLSEDMRAEWQAEVERRDDMKSLEQSIKTIDQERALLETHFAASSDVVPFLDMIEKTAASVGTKAEVVLVDVPKDDPSLMVTVQVTGTFGGVYKSLMLLENSPYELSFTSMDMRKSPGVDAAGGWSATFSIRLLSFIK